MSVISIVIQILRDVTGQPCAQPITFDLIWNALRAQTCTCTCTRTGIHGLISPLADSALATSSAPWHQIDITSRKCSVLHGSVMSERVWQLLQLFPCHLHHTEVFWESTTRRTVIKIRKSAAAANNALTNRRAAFDASLFWTFFSKRTPWSRLRE